MREPDRRGPGHSPALAARPFATLRWRNGASQSTDRWVAEEAPVAIVHDGSATTVLMATPSRPRGRLDRVRPNSPADGSKTGVVRYVTVEVEMTRSRSPDIADATLDADEGYRALFENMTEGFVVCEAIRGPDSQLVDYWIRAANPVFLKRAPAGGAIINRRQLDVRPDTSKPWLKACERALGGGAVRFEFQDPMSHRWYEVHMARLSATEFGQFFVDVTERKTTEQRLVQLFDELNHRVKNNLAIASSILELQARTSSADVREQLRKAIDRLHSIAALHTALYQQNSTETADLRRYLHDLCERLSGSLFEDGRVRIEVDCQAIEALVEQAVTLGLIVNELVTNAAKHAFPNAAHGAIGVILTASDDDLHLTVADNGCGSSALGKNHAEGGLGLRLVRSLVVGQGGDLRVESGAGTVFHLRLPRRGPAPQTHFQPRLL